ncbi:hypothetical protein HWV62_40160 [Athelia sp. TMB]|nr:hypothetical protein HWV62_40160 [Athelia sp. TMB]
MPLLKRTPGRLPWVRGTKLAFFTAGCKDWQDAKIKGQDAVGVFYTNFTKKLIATYGWHFDLDNEDKDCPEPSQEVWANIQNTAGLDQDEIDRRLAYYTSLRKKVRQWWCSYYGKPSKEDAKETEMEVKTTLAKISKTLPKAPRRTRLTQFYGRWYLCSRWNLDYGTLQKAELDRVLNPGEQRLQPLDVVNKVAKQYWEKEPEEFKKWVEGEREKEHAENVRKYEEKMKALDVIPQAPEDYQRALSNAAAFMQPLCDLTAKKFGGAVTMLVVLPVENGEIEMRSVFSGKTNGLIPKTFPEFDPEGFNALQEAYVNFGQHVYSKADRNLRVLQTRVPEGVENEKEEDDGYIREEQAAPLNLFEDLVSGPSPSPLPPSLQPLPSSTSAPPSSVFTPPSPAPLPCVPAPQSSVPAPQPSVPASPSSTPTPPSSTPTPLSSTPTPPSSTPTPPSSAPTPPSSAPTPPSSAPTPPSSTPTLPSSTPTVYASSVPSPTPSSPPTQPAPFSQPSPSSSSPPAPSLLPSVPLQTSPTGVAAILEAAGIDNMPPLAAASFSGVLDVASQWGAEWAQLVAAFIEFERAAGFITQELRLPTSSLRPPCFKVWYSQKRAMKGKEWEALGTGSAATFGASWWAWWTDIKPQDPASDWKRLYKAGPTGIFLVLVGLVWWKMMVGVGEDSSWSTAVLEVRDVLKRAHQPLLPSSPQKKRKRARVEVEVKASDIPRSKKRASVPTSRSLGISL